MAETSTEIQACEAVERPRSESQIHVEPQQQQGTDERELEEDDAIENQPDILPPSNEEVSVQQAASAECLVEPVERAEYLDARKLLISPDGTNEDPPKRERSGKHWSKCSGSCFKRTLYVLTSSLFFAMYACGGAYLFSTLESERDVEYNDKVEKWKNDTAILLATELRQVTPYEKTWSKTVFRYLDYFEKDLLKASAMGYKRKDDKDRGQTWTFKRSLFFSISLMTTTGVGSNLARSEWNEAIVIGYTFFGILITIVWLAIIGSCLASLWWWIFQNFCCPFCNGDDSTKIHPLLMDDKFSDTNSASDFLVTVLFPLLILLVYYVFGAATLSFFADWTISRSFYFNFAMFVTLGPGCQEAETTASNYDYRQNIYYIIYWLFGLCLISMFLNLICLLRYRKRYRRKICRQVALPSNGKLRTDHEMPTNQVQCLN